MAEYPSAIASPETAEMRRLLRDRRALPPNLPPRMRALGAGSPAGSPAQQNAGRGGDRRLWGARWRASGGSAEQRSCVAQRVDHLVAVLVFVGV